MKKPAGIELFLQYHSNGSAFDAPGQITTELPRSAPVGQLWASVSFLRHPFARLPNLIVFFAAALNPACRFQLRI
jgi:hypothetical protein